MLEKIKEMLSESNGTSCMRFCVTLVVCTLMINWTAGTVAVLMGTVDSAGINTTEVVTLIGVLAAKMGQKKIEVK